MKKKLVSLAVALAMLFSLAAPTLAEEQNTTQTLPLHLMVAWGYQKSGTALIPGKEYPIEDLMDMIQFGGQMEDGLPADMSKVTIKLEDNKNISNGGTLITDNTFTILYDDYIKFTANTSTASIPFNVRLRTINTGAAIKNMPQNSHALKGQFQLALSSQQQAQLGDTYDVSFYYRVDPGTLMHNFMVYNTDGTMMADKGNGFYILQGTVKQTGGTLGTSSVELEQEQDDWLFYCQNIKIGYCKAPSRNVLWHKITVKYRPGGIKVLIDGKDALTTIVDYSGIDTDGYMKVPENYKISKIGPIGTQGWRQPNLSPEADLNRFNLYKTEMGWAAFDDFRVYSYSNNKEVFKYDCNSNEVPSFLTSNWQIEGTNSGNPVLQSPLFDYAWDHDSESDGETIF